MPMRLLFPLLRLTAVLRDLSMLYIHTSRQPANTVGPSVSHVLASQSVMRPWFASVRVLVANRRRKNVMWVSRNPRTQEVCKMPNLFPFLPCSAPKGQRRSRTTSASTAFELMRKLAVFKIYHPSTHPHLLDGSRSSSPFGHHLHVRLWPYAALTSPVTA